MTLTTPEHVHDFLNAIRLRMLAAVDAGGAVLVRGPNVEAVREAGPEGFWATRPGADETFEVVIPTPPG